MIYMLFVTKDGSVFTTQYCNDNDYDFNRRKALRDPEIFNQTDPMTKIGKPTETECSRLAEAVADTNPEAACFVRNSAKEPVPDVQETQQLSHQLYLSGASDIYVAYSAGEQKGVSVRSEDPNAMEAVHMIQDTEIFQQWLQNHL